MIRTLSYLALFLLVSPFLATAQDELTTEEFYKGIQSGRFDAVFDVRSQEEWDAGHIPSATHVVDLASTGNADEYTNCENCTIAFYCGIGVRAGMAIDRMIDDYGFGGTLLNGLGVEQWLEANYSLVDTDSVDPLCRVDNNQCTCCDERGPGDTNSTDDDGEDAATGTNMMVAMLASLLFVPFM